MIYNRLSKELSDLKSKGNLRIIPSDSTADNLIDLSTNDYLGIASRDDLIDEFYNILDVKDRAPSAVASRLLASSQDSFLRLESTLAHLYGRPALLFNSGYHANTGIISALAGKHTMILADRLVHASIIDGIKLSGAKFTRFRHNDFLHLERLVKQCGSEVDEILVIVESIYSMDGDRADIDALISLKRLDPRIILYVDEAHAFGVEGPSGLGLVAQSIAPGEVDVVVGTLGKAAASTGAFAISSPIVNQYLVNRCRSLIFSTALPPVAASWSSFVIEKMVGMDSEREHLRHISKAVAKTLAEKCEIEYMSGVPSHIIPYIVGDAETTMRLSQSLKAKGVKVLPIRTPTVPPGTERLRISLSASLSEIELQTINKAFHEVL